MGAEVVRQGAIYEDSMAAAAAAPKERLALLSDSSWPGYTERPHRLMEGYLVLMQEAVAQIAMAAEPYFLQAGVGGLAAAAAAFAREAWGEAPKIVVVEPEVAPALYASVQAGAPVVTTGPVSAMGRLDCKEPSLIALKGLARDADGFVTISEAEGQAGAEAAAAAGLASTPSGAAGLAALLAGSAARVWMPHRTCADPERGTGMTQRRISRGRVCRPHRPRAGRDGTSRSRRAFADDRAGGAILHRLPDAVLGKPDAALVSWFPLEGQPIAVIPSIGAHLMGQTWVNDIRTWQAPDYHDDGVCCWRTRCGGCAGGWGFGGRCGRGKPSADAAG